MNRPLLIIEDNAQNMYMMRFLLEKSGFLVLGAEDGKKGVEAALTAEPLAILLDIQLPGLDGYAVAAELKRYPQLAGVPIIAVTSYAMVGDRIGFWLPGPPVISKNRSTRKPLWRKSAAIFPKVGTGLQGDNDADTQCRR
jgi:CheY-like chemotaxis protein